MEYVSKISLAALQLLCITSLYGAASSSSHLSDATSSSSTRGSSALPSNTVCNILGIRQNQTYFDAEYMLSNYLEKRNSDQTGQSYSTLPIDYASALVFIQKNTGSRPIELSSPQNKRKLSNFIEHVLTQTSPNALKSNIFPLQAIISAKSIEDATQEKLKARLLSLAQRSGSSLSAMHHAIDSYTMLEWLGNTQDDACQTIKASLQKQAESFATRKIEQKEFISAVEITEKYIHIFEGNKQLTAQLKQLQTDLFYSQEFEPAILLFCKETLTSTSACANFFKTLTKVIDHKQKHALITCLSSNLEAALKDSVQELQTFKAKTCKAKGILEQPKMTETLRTNLQSSRNLLDALCIMEHGTKYTDQKCTEIIKSEHFRSFIKLLPYLRWSSCHSFFVNFYRPQHPQLKACCAELLQDLLFEILDFAKQNLDLLYLKRIFLNIHKLISIDLKDYALAKEIMYDQKYINFCTNLCADDNDDGPAPSSSGTLQRKSTNSKKDWILHLYSRIAQSTIKYSEFHPVHYKIALYNAMYTGDEQEARILLEFFLEKDATETDNFICARQQYDLFVFLNNATDQKLIKQLAKKNNQHPIAIRFQAELASNKQYFVNVCKSTRQCMQELKKELNTKKGEHQNEPIIITSLEKQKEANSWNYMHNETMLNRCITQDLGQKFNRLFNQPENVSFLRTCNSMNALTWIINTELFKEINASLAKLRKMDGADLSDFINHEAQEAMQALVQSIESIKEENISLSHSLMIRLSEAVDHMYAFGVSAIPNDGTIKKALGIYATSVYINPQSMLTNFCLNHGGLSTMQQAQALAYIARSNAGGKKTLIDDANFDTLKQYTERCITNKSFHLLHLLVNISGKYKKHEKLRRQVQQCAQEKLESSLGNDLDSLLACSILEGCGGNTEKFHRCFEVEEIKKSIEKLSHDERSTYYCPLSLECNVGPKDEIIELLATIMTGYHTAEETAHGRMLEIQGISKKSQSQPVSSSSNNNGPDNPQQRSRSHHPHIQQKVSALSKHTAAQPDQSQATSWWHKITGKTVVKTTLVAAVVCGIIYWLKKKKKASEQIIAQAA